MNRFEEPTELNFQPERKSRSPRDPVEETRAQYLMRRFNRTSKLDTVNQASDAAIAAQNAHTAAVMEIVKRLEKEREQET